MASKAAMTKNDDTAEQIAQADDVEKIRDIIFGGQMREYQKRFQQLEKSVEESIARLAARLSSLQENLATESAQRVADTAASKRETEDLERRVTDRLADLASANNGRFDELAATLKANQAALLASVVESKTQLTNALNDSATELERRKVAAEELSLLFGELAQRLSMSRQ